MVLDPPFTAWKGGEMLLSGLVAICLAFAPLQDVEGDFPEGTVSEDPYFFEMDGTPISVVLSDHKLETYELTGEWTELDGEFIATGSGPHTVTAYFNQEFDGVDVLDIPVLPLTSVSHVDEETTISDDGQSLDFTPGGLYLEYDWAPIEAEAEETPPTDTDSDATIGDGPGPKFPNPDSFIMVFKGDCWKDKASGKKGRKCSNSQDTCLFMIYTKIGRFRGQSDCKDNGGEYGYEDIGGVPHLVPERFLIEGPRIRNPQ